MIAKRIQNRKGTSSFARLSRYVVDARGQIDPRTWSRTADYILDSIHDGAKVGGVRITNCAADEPAAATLEVLATQALNTRSKSDKTYHLVVSFPVGERPTMATMLAIENRLCEAIGLADHQRLSAVHNDTAHLHMHIAINKVHPKTRRNVEPYYDQPRLMEACERLEIEYGLQRTNHGLTRDPELSNSQEQSNERQPDRYAGADRNDPAYLESLHQSYLAAIGEEPEAQTLDGVRSLSGVDLVHDARRADVLLPDHEAENVEHRRAKHDARVRRTSDGRGGASGENGEVVGGYATGPRVDGRAGDMEAHAGRDSLAGWIKREAIGAFDAGDWQALHRELALHDLAIKPRGAGLVVTTRDGNVAVRPSEIRRNLSMAALTRRFGPYEPPAPNVVDIRAAKQYRQAPKHGHANTGALFAEFQRSQVTAQQVREQQRRKLRDDHARYAKELADYHRRRREAIQKSRMSGPARRAAYLALAGERANDWKARKELEAQQRAAIAKQNPTPAWQEWLAQRANTGDEAALSVLRSRERKRERFVADWLRADDQNAARDVIYKSMSPKTDKAGVVHYEVGDGGTVKDGRDGVRVEQRSEAAQFLALLLAADKFAGQALIVEGSDAFKADVARIAGEKGMPVVFVDPEMERQRQAASGPAKAKPEPAVERQAIDAFIQSRNAQRAKVSTIGYHRTWTPEDAGEAIYQGRRRLADGSEAVLLQRGDTVLVMPATTAQAAKASSWSVGSKVSTDSRGRFVDNGKTAKPTRGAKR